MQRTPIITLALCGLTWAGGCYVKDTVLRGQKAVRDIEALTPEIEKRNKEVDELTNPEAAPAEPSSTP
jgi:hypothetical protein